MLQRNAESNKLLNDSYIKNSRGIDLLRADKNNYQVAELHRQLLATKYAADTKLHDKNNASILLGNKQKMISALVDDKLSINNYKDLVQIDNFKPENNPREWKCKNITKEEASKLWKSLPCQKSSLKPCNNSFVRDRDIENLVDKWKQEKDPPKSSNIPKIPKESSFNLPNNTKKPTQFTVKFPSNCINKNYSNVQPKEQIVHPLSHPKARQLNTFTNNTVHNQPGNNLGIVQPQKPSQQDFITAREELNIQMAKQNKQVPQKIRKTLGGKRSANGQFVNPFKREDEKNQAPSERSGSNSDTVAELEDERLKGIDPKMIELIRNEIMDSGTKITWDDIAGLEYAKRIIQEIVVLPMLRPDIFTGLRRPPKGILLFGPPGTGKTLIGKCIASQSKSTFFSISASSLTSKWIGEGEKMVRALFAVARVHQPAVIFIDEIDSLLTQRSETEHESSRRIKTEFLVQLDGAATEEEDRILIVGATNRPYELDEAARRRLVKRLYIPLPEPPARGQIVENLLKTEKHELTQVDIQEISSLTGGYSGADMTNLCKEASMGPIRSIPFDQLENINPEQVPHVTMQDFQNAIKCVRPSVSQGDLQVYLDWNKTYGTGGNPS